MNGERCICGAITRNSTGLCESCLEAAMTVPKPDALVVHIVDEMGFDECQECGAALDLPGLCGLCSRCLNPLNEWLERLPQ